MIPRPPISTLFPYTTLFRSWVVTNTRFSTDAIQYGTCAGLNLLGWDFPKKKSLKEQIDTLGLYPVTRSEEHTSELQSQSNLVCRLLLEKKKKKTKKKI